jgi:hypothetical protein
MPALTLQALEARAAALREIVLRLDLAGHAERAARWMPAYRRVEAALERGQLRAATLGESAAA